MKCLVLTTEIADSYISEYIELVAPTEIKNVGEYEEIVSHCTSNQKKIVQIVADEEVFPVHPNLIWVDAPSELSNQPGEESKWYYDENDQTIKPKGVAPVPAVWQAS